MDPEWRYGWLAPALAAGWRYFTMASGAPFAMMTLGRESMFVQGA